MLLENKELENTVWEKVFKQLGFKPDCTVRTHNFSVSMPFDINVAFSVYGIEKMSDSQIDGMGDIIRKIFIEATKENERIYALDWEHSSFLYDPRNPDEQKSVWVDDARYFGEDIVWSFLRFIPMRTIIFLLMKISDSVIWSIHGGKKYGYSVNCWFINLIRSITN